VLLCDEYTRFDDFQAFIDRAVNAHRVTPL
jgi:hypothetical protein